jgi:hypothetical protein
MKMKVVINQSHIDNDSDSRPSIVSAIEDALKENHPNVKVGMINGDITVKYAPEDFTTKVIALKGEARAFETRMLRGIEVSPCEIFVDLKNLAKL